MDRSKLGKTVLWIFLIHVVLSMVVLGGTLSSNYKVIQFAFGLGGFVMIIYPIVGGLIYIVVSLIGMIKNKKFLPYLICPVISFVLWLIVGGALAVYM